MKMRTRRRALSHNPARLALARRWGDPRLRPPGGRFYRLIGRKVFPARNILDLEVGRHVGDTIINGVRVSTVFLSLDHNYDPEGPPIVFETMVFGGKQDGIMARYSTYDEAEAGHARYCYLVSEYHAALLAQPKEIHD